MPWLARFLSMSFVFNVLAFIEQVAVSFGLQIYAWLQQNRQLISVLESVQAALLKSGANLNQVVQAWDTDKTGQISKREFRQGLSSLGIKKHYLNQIFKQIDQDGAGSITAEDLRRFLSSRGGFQSQDAEASHRVEETTPLAPSEDELHADVRAAQPSFSPEQTSNRDPPATTVAAPSDAEAPAVTSSVR
eukprot:6460097-Prymnesium_polylepis.1